MDDMTNSELVLSWEDAKSRAHAFWMRAMNSVDPRTRFQNEQMQKFHAEQAAKYLAELIRRTEN
jgi:hypothetical protein